MQFSRCGARRAIKCPQNVKLLYSYLFLHCTFPCNSARVTTITSRLAYRTRLQASEEAHEIERERERRVGDRLGKQFGVRPFEKVTTITSRLTYRTRLQASEEAHEIEREWEEEGGWSSRKTVLQIKSIKWKTGRFSQIQRRRDGYHRLPRSGPTFPSTQVIDVTRPSPLIRQAVHHLLTHLAPIDSTGMSMVPEVITA
ncbi:hypothetical protein J6590_005795 [Homalodisca vitripennis]|nr:hypothetical protein J6590_005795 [Homalodisca vitripennis]